MFYELEVCETADKSFSGTGTSNRFHVELRFIEKEGESALIFTGPTRTTRVGAELDMDMVPFKPTKRAVDKETGTMHSVPGEIG